MIIVADNLTTGVPDRHTRRRYQSAFLPMLAAAGLGMILMNVLHPAIMRVARTCRNITDGRVFTWHWGQRTSGRCP